MGPSHTTRNNLRLVYENREQHGQTTVVEKVWYDPVSGDYYYRYVYRDRNGDTVTTYENAAGADQREVQSQRDAFRDEVSDIRS